MKSLRGGFALIAVLLAVVIPLEQAHCVWMGLAQAVPAPSPIPGAGHNCCAPSAPRPQPSRSSTDCVCITLPPLSLPVSGISATALLPLSCLAVPQAPSDPMAGLVAAPHAALEFGSPPLPVDPGAHGLR